MKQAISAVPGVDSVEIDYSKKTATIKLKEGVKNDDALLAAIKTALKATNQYSVKA